MGGSDSRTLRIAVILFLVTLLVLGFAIRSVTIQSMTDSALAELEHSSLILSELATAYYAEGTLGNMQFLINLDLTSKIADVDILVCGQSGRIILCSESPTGCAHQSYSLTQDYMDSICQTGHISNVSILQNIYEDTRYLSARPIYSDTDATVVGYIIVSTPTSEANRMVTKVANFFLTCIAVVTVLTAFMMVYLARRKNSPLRELAKAARAFGHGDLDARVRLTGRHPEQITELALAFNNMASSLQKSEYSRQEFVANISHELKTPMTTIGGYIDGMRDGTIPPERHSYYMALVSEETKRLSRLVRSMLDIARLQSEGGISMENMSRFEVQECAYQMLISFEQKITDKQLQVDVDFPDHPVFALANRDHISQVIYNLLDNAVKFCPEGGNLRLRLQESDSKLLLSVANEGQTIPSEELSLLFDRFHKIDKSRSENRDGWGLGLYIVKTILGLHGEDISVTSMDGLTEFTFTLTPVN